MTTKEEMRVLRHIRRCAGRVLEGATQGKALVEVDQRGTVAIASASLERLCLDGTLRLTGQRIELTELGTARLERAAKASSREGEGMDGLARRDLRTTRVAMNGHDAEVVVNLLESPLRDIARRKDRQGRNFLAAREVEAGERLRRDYERGQLMPRLGANWEASVSSGRRDGTGGIAELTDAALSARLRVDKGLEAVGPELAGVLVDVCCFLKGMETLEFERSWPARSGKVVLRTALRMLARHYWPESGRARNASPLHWGGENYRPTSFSPEAKPG